MELWKKSLNTLPATKPNIEYGTTAMTREIQRLFRETNLSEQKIFAMGGHEEGIVAFGKDLDEARNIIFYQINNLC